MHIEELFEEARVPHFSNKSGEVFSQYPRPKHTFSCHTSLIGVPSAHAPSRTSMRGSKPSGRLRNLPRRSRLHARRATAPPPLSVIVSPRDQCADEVGDEPSPAPAEIRSAQPTRFPDWAHGGDVQAPVVPALGNQGHPTGGRFACPTSCQFRSTNGFSKPNTALVSRGNPPTECM